MHELTLNSFLFLIVLERIIRTSARKPKPNPKYAMWVNEVRSLPKANSTMHRSVNSTERELSISHSSNIDSSVVRETEFSIFSTASSDQLDFSPVSYSLYSYHFIIHPRHHS